MRKEYRKLGAFRIPAYLARPMSLRVSPARGGRPVRERVVGAEEEPHDDDEDERDEDRREKELKDRAMLRLALHVTPLPRE